MKGSKKCKKNDCQKDKKNSMNEAKLESVQGGLGMPANWKPSDGARGEKINLKKCHHVPMPIMTLEEKDDWTLYGREK